MARRCDAPVSATIDMQLLPRSTSPRLSALATRALLLAAAAMVGPALASQGEQATAQPPLLLFSAGTANDGFDVYGRGPWRVAGGEAEAAVSPDATWRPFFLERGGLWSSDKLSALTSRARLLRGSSIMGGDRGHPVWIAFGKSSDAYPLPDTRIVLCPQGESPEIKSCVSAASLEARLLSKPANDRSVIPAKWTDGMLLLELRLMPGMKADKVVHVLDAEQRTTMVAKWEAINRNEQNAWNERREREDRERAERQTVHNARESAAKDEFETAQAGKALMCDTGRRVLEPGFQLATVAVACPMSNGHRISVRLGEALQMGWVIDSQVVTPITNAIGENGFSINVVLRKR